jgi:extracellular matrix regulatory protein A
MTPGNNSKGSKSRRSDGTSPRVYPPYLWPVGLGGLVASQRVLAAGSWASAPIRRAANSAKAEGRLINLTYGRACKWALFLDTGHIVLTAVPMPVTVWTDEDFDEYLSWKDQEGIP